MTWRRFFLSCIVSVLPVVAAMLLPRAVGCVNFQFDFNRKIERPIIDRRPLFPLHPRRSEQPEQDAAETP